MMEIRLLTIKDEEAWTFGPGFFRAPPSRCSHSRREMTPRALSFRRCFAIMLGSDVLSRS
jgi:hypothetical protein